MGVRGTRKRCVEIPVGIKKGMVGGGEAGLRDGPWEP